MSKNPTRAIQIANYDPQWPHEFAELSRVLKPWLGNLVLAIEHVGSTAVPGLAAKPIIDFDIVIQSRSLLGEVIDRLAELGYEHQGDLGIADREAFDRQSPDVPRTGDGRLWREHHLYVCARDAAELAKHLAFRDYLRANTEAASAYAELKRKLAERFRDDRDSYCKAKTEFIERVLNKVSPGPDPKT